MGEVSIESGPAHFRVRGLADEGTREVTLHLLQEPRALFSEHMAHESHVPLLLHLQPPMDLRVAGQREPFAVREAGLAELGRALPLGGEDEIVIPGAAQRAGEVQMGVYRPEGRGAEAGAYPERMRGIVQAVVNAEVEVVVSGQVGQALRRVVLSRGEAPESAEAVPAGGVGAEGGVIADGDAGEGHGDCLWLGRSLSSFANGGRRVARRPLLSTDSTGGVGRPSRW